MYNDITGVILSGGKSTRMGTNKSFLKIGNKTVIEKITELMRSLFERVILITNTPEEYSFLGIEVFRDIYAYQGPLAGIHSGLINSQTEKCFIISCDIPRITKDAIEFICKYPSESTIIVPEADGYIQQLCGIYSKSLLPKIEESFITHNPKPINHENHLQVKNKKCKVLSLVESSDSTIINIETEFTDYFDGMFLNMNRPEDYEKILDAL